MGFLFIPALLTEVNTDQIVNSAVTLSKLSSEQINNYYLDMFNYTVISGTWIESYDMTPRAYTIMTLYNSVTAINDEINFPVSLPSGSYDILLLYGIQNNGGILTITDQDNNVLDNSLDTYTGSGSDYKKKATISITTSQPITKLKFKMLSKNASSSGYRLNLNGITINET